MIEVRQLSKQYGQRKAVQNLSFTVRKGEVVGFLGPNGAGKTTTMKILTGCMAATSGEIYIDGKDIFEDPIAAKSKIGYLPETPPLYGDMRVENYLRYTAVLKNTPKKQLTSLVERALSKTGLLDVRKRLIQNLSKGFKQRVGLAQALVSDPEILILDEPTIGLDPSQIIEVRRLIAGLKGKHTIILSTHILSEVQAGCDRVLIIKDGRMAAQESLSSLRDKQYKGQRNITVRVHKTSQNLISLLNQLEGVQSAKAGSSSQTLYVQAKREAGSSINEEIAKKVIESGAGLMELNESFNLEDVFLRLTGSQTDTQKDSQKDPAKSHAAAKGEAL